MVSEIKSNLQDMSRRHGHWTSQKLSWVPRLLPLKTSLLNAALDPTLFLPLAPQLDVFVRAVFLCSHCLHLECVPRSQRSVLPLMAVRNCLPSQGNCSLVLCCISRTDCDHVGRYRAAVWYDRPGSGQTCSSRYSFIALHSFFCGLLLLSEPSFFRSPSVSMNFSFAFPCPR